MRPRLTAPRAPTDLIILAVLALWVLTVGMGLRDPWPADEPRFALIGKQIVDSGQWLIPARGPELYAEKPPVYLWLQAAAYALTGSTRSAFLLPSLLAALGTLVLVWDLARRCWGRRTAFWTTLALLFSVQFALQGRSAQIDAVLCFFTTLGLYGLLRHLWLGPAWRWYALAGVATGLGVITKGTGFLPWLLLLPYALARRWQWRGLPEMGRDWRWLLGPLVFLATIAAWALPILLLANQPGHEAVAAYRDDLLLRQTLTRYADPWHHHKPFWYYLAQVVPLLWLPLSFLAVLALRPWWRRIRRGDARVFMLLGWVALVLLFFSASPGKREVYILPALPALALAFAPLLRPLLARQAARRTLLVLTGLLVAIMVGGSLWALLGTPRFAERIALEQGVRPWYWFGAVGLIGAAAMLLWHRRAHLAWGALMLALWTGYGLFGYPAMNDARSGRGLLAKAEAAMPADATLGLANVPEQMLLQAPETAFAFGFKRPAHEQLSAAFDWLRAASTHWLLTHGEPLDACLDGDRGIDLGWSNRRHWYLLQAHAIVTDCVPIDRRQTLDPAPDETDD